MESNKFLHGDGFDKMRRITDARREGWDADIIWYPTKWHI